jgi:hypothetical protein
MRKYAPTVLFLGAVLMVLLNLSCVEGEGGGGTQYILNVSLATGVTGTPPTGTYSHGENSTVTYSYTTQAGYGDLAVTLDGTPVGNSGIVTMNTNHVLNASASVDVRGSWEGLHTDDNNSVLFRATFSGASAASGNVSGHIDSPTGYGNFTVSGANITFFLDFGYARFDCVGTIANVNFMSGTWSNSKVFSGTWELTRQ